VGDEEQVFEKFYRAASGRQRADGTGLGLAICRAIVEAHGGQIGVRRPPEGGAEFWFRLPLAEIEAGVGCSVIGVRSSDDAVPTPNTDHRTPNTL
jgi:K+-sensing histidine kinase KdpD